MRVSRSRTTTSFQLKDAKEIKGVAKNTRLLLKGDRKDDPFKETPQAMVSRILRDLGPDKQQIVVLNDEAHHCYLDRPLQGGEKPTRSSRTRTSRPASGSAACSDRKARGHQADLRPVGDAVLPEGLRLQRGLHLPVDGQRLLADGRDRVGHRQGPAHARSTTTPTDPLVTYLRLWDYVGDRAPQASREGYGRGLASAEGARGCVAQPLPQLREGVRALGEGAGSRRRDAAGVHRRLLRTPSSPSSSTTGSRASKSSRTDEVVAHSPGKLAAASATSWTASRSRGRARSSIDSAQLESGDGLKDDFKKVAGRRDRGLQGRSTARATRVPTSRRSTDERAPPRGDEHRRQAGQARRARPLRRQRLDAHRGLGRQHRHPHPRRARVSAASCCASRSSVVACAAARTQSNEHGHVRARVRQRLRHPVPVHLLRQAAQGSAAAEAGDRGMCG